SGEAMHDTPRTSPASTLTVLHVGLAAVGFFVVRTLPSSSVATHSVVDAHETLSRITLSMLATVHVAPAPSAASVHIPPLPAVPTAAHSAVEGHEIALKCTADALAVLTVVSPHVALVPSPGSAVVNTLPSLSTEAHRVVAGQDVPVILFSPTIPDWVFQLTAS